VIQYEPHPIDTSIARLPSFLGDVTERLAENAHELWAKQRIADGWKWGPQRDDQSKTHPGLVPYSDLPDGEKNYDRIVAVETLKAIMTLGYEIRPIASPDASSSL
jgi:RyR domain